jgi:peptidoglycan glycosyltransferase
VNAPLRKVAISVLVLFTLLILNVNIIQVVRADKLRNDKGNTRVLTEQYSRERGAIVVDGNEIASSVKTNDALKYQRTYANGPLYAAATGYYSALFGKSGLEDAENGVLAGTDDRLAFRRIGDILTGRDPSGGNVVLTLDPAVQQAAMDGLKGVTGAVVAIDPTTGAILGMASTPTYDPALLSSHDAAATRAYEKSITPAEGSGDPDPMLNQAIGARYSPGSVFKLIVSAAALSSGDYNPDTTVPAPNVYTPPGTSTGIKNYNGETCNGGADQALIDALTISCNTAFAQLGVTLGEDKVRDMAQAFGIDDDGFDMPLTVVPSTVGPIADDAALAQSSIGQRDVQLTPLQAAMISAAIANKGRLMKPYLVDSIQAPDLTVVDQTDAEEMSHPISAAVAGELTTMMTSVVANGTGKKARIDGVQVAGKTGTAEVGTTGDEKPPHTWFTGFAPADNPKIAVAVFIKNGGQSGTEGTGTGGDISAPIAKAVMQAYLNGAGAGG